MDRNLAEEWYIFAQKQQEPYTRFIMLWFAFNWLYNGVHLPKESARIMKFCHDHISKLKTFDAFNSGAIEIFQKQPVMNMREQNVGETQEEHFKNITGANKSIEHLILSIYQVRCNLFHGSKSAFDPRDQELVAASGTIMQGYLQILLDVQQS